jgi:hypothetical protein
MSGIKDKDIRQDESRYKAAGKKTADTDKNTEGMTHGYIAQGATGIVRKERAERVSLRQSEHNDKANLAACYSLFP